MKLLACSAVLWSLLVTGGCGESVQIEEVKINLTRKNCALESQPNPLASVSGVWVALERRGNYQLFSDCRDTYGGYQDLDGLETKLAELTLERVPADGMWTLWVLGTDRLCCLGHEADTQVFLCGVQRDVPIPPPGHQLTIEIDCLDLVSGSTGPASDGVKACRVDRPPFRTIGSCGLP